MITNLHRGSVVFCSLLLIACAADEEAADIETANVPPATATAPALLLESAIGTWQTVTLSETGDTLTTSSMTITADPSQWTVTFPDRPVIPARLVEASGDSIVTEFGPFESVLRPGVQVTARTTNRMQGDELVGTFSARYLGAGIDSVLNGRVVGRRQR